MKSEILIINPTRISPFTRNRTNIDRICGKMSEIFPSVEGQLDTTNKTIYLDGGENKINDVMGVLEESKCLSDIYYTVIVKGSTFIEILSSISNVTRTDKNNIIVQFDRITRIPMGDIIMGTCTECGSPEGIWRGINEPKLCNKCYQKSLNDLNRG